MSERPDWWVVKGGFCGDFGDVYEAGASAILPWAKEQGRRELLEELKAKGQRIEALPDGRMIGHLPYQVGESGWLVFIPEAQP